MYNASDMDWMIKSMLINKRDNKGTMKFNFVTSCLAFRISITLKKKKCLLLACEKVVHDWEKLHKEYKKLNEKLKKQKYLCGSLSIEWKKKK